MHHRILCARFAIVKNKVCGVNLLHVNGGLVLFTPAGWVTKQAKPHAEASRREPRSAVVRR
jgi:hypothetical protein